MVVSQSVSSEVLIHEWTRVCGKHRTKQDKGLASIWSRVPQCDALLIRTGVRFAEKAFGPLGPGVPSEQQPQPHPLGFATQRQTAAFPLTKTSFVSFLCMFSQHLVVTMTNMYWRI